MPPCCYMTADPNFRRQQLSKESVVTLPLKDSAAEGLFLLTHMPLFAASRSRMGKST